MHKKPQPDMAQITQGILSSLLGTRASRPGLALGGSALEQEGGDPSAFWFRRTWAVPLGHKVLSSTQPGVQPQWQQEPGRVGGPEFLHVFELPCRGP